MKHDEEILIGGRRLRRTFLPEAMAQRMAVVSEVSLLLLFLAAVSTAWSPYPGWTLSLADPCFESSIWHGALLLPPALLVAAFSLRQRGQRLCALTLSLPLMLVVVPAILSGELLPTHGAYPMTDVPSPAGGRLGYFWTMWGPNPFIGLHVVQQTPVWPGLPGLVWRHTVYSCPVGDTLSPIHLTPDGAARTVRITLAEPGGKELLLRVAPLAAPPVASGTTR